LQSHYIGAIYHGVIILDAALLVKWYASVYNNFITVAHYSVKEKGRQPMSYASKFQSRENDDLFRAILALETQEECYRFFEDLMTIKELQAIAQRWEVARMLHNGKTYHDIAAATNASAATISRINKCLLYGAEGYRRILERLEKEDR
jgi:TrpR-related protein YerC/YecD